MSRRFQLCAPSPITQQMRVVRHLRFEEGELLVKQEKAEFVEDAEGNVLGFYLRTVQRAPAKLKPVALRKPKTVMLGEANRDASCCLLSKLEVEAVVGLHGESQTAHLSEAQRSERVRLHWEAEDLVERATNKFRAMYPERMQAA